MAKRIFEIGSASEEELEGVRLALCENEIKYYETPRGDYGNSMAAIWIENDTDYSKARVIIAEFQTKFRMNQISMNQKENNNKTIDWKYVPFALLVLAIVLWMLLTGYSR